MKKLIYFTMMFCLLGIFSPQSLLASDSRNPEKVPVERKLDEKEIQALVKRVDEIKAMDFKTLSSTEKKALRKELKEIKGKMKYVTGVYISAGALIVIIILLLLLL